MLNFLICLFVINFTQSNYIKSDDYYECGILALYRMSKLYNLDVSLESIDRRIGAKTATGHSLLDVRNAGNQIGLDLVGITLSKSDNITSPILAFVQKDGHGHYIVVRPIGRTGKLVQVFDAFGTETEVLDYSELASRPGWTGIALSRRGRVPLMMRIAQMVGLTSGLIIVSWLLLSKLRPSISRRKKKDVQGKRIREDS